MGSHLVPGRSLVQRRGSWAHGGLCRWPAELRSHPSLRWRPRMPPSQNVVNCLLSKPLLRESCFTPEEVCIHIFFKRTKSLRVPGILNEPPQLSSVKSAVWRNPAISTLSLSPHYCLLDYKKYTFSQIPFEELLWKRLLANTNHLPHAQQILQWSRKFSQLQFVCEIAVQKGSTDLALWRSITGKGEYPYYEVVTKLRTLVTMLFKQNFIATTRKLGSFGRQCQREPPRTLKVEPKTQLPGIPCLTWSSGETCQGGFQSCSTSKFYSLITF